MKPAKILCIAFLVVLFNWPSIGISAEEQYKKHARDAISEIVDGNYHKAITHFKTYLKQHPADLESFYGLVVAYTKMGQIDTAMQYVTKAIETGLPFNRFLAGPRDLLAPLVGSDGFQKLMPTHGTELLHGPLLGCITDTSATFWLRTFSEVPVQVRLSRSEDMDDPVQSKITTTRRIRDFTALIDVIGLNPATKYYYELLVNHQKQARTYSFRTVPVAGQKCKIQVGFGGGAGYTPQHERMWRTIASHNLLAFFLLGDNVYIDNPTRPPVQQYCYYRRQSRPEFRDFTAGTAIFAIYDDHDFSTNDSWGGPEVNEPGWKIPVWRLFRDNWNNPYYGGGEIQPGCWFDVTIGAVDFFLLDGRYYRTDPNCPEPSMLGPVQKKWLLEKLGNSKASFKILAAPVPWVFGAKPGSLDTWEGYKHEREEIFTFIETNRIDGVVLLSADRHRSDAWKIEREHGYTLYEFESSKISNIHTHQKIPGALFSYNEKCSFGLLTFDTSLADPEVSYQVINIDNDCVYDITIKLSQLSF